MTIEARGQNGAVMVGDGDTGREWEVEEGGREEKNDNDRNKVGERGG